MSWLSLAAAKWGYRRLDLWWCHLILKKVPDGSFASAARSEIHLLYLGIWRNVTARRCRGTGAEHGKALTQTGGAHHDRQKKQHILCVVGSSIAILKDPTMTRIVIMLACFVPAPALAHVGHVGGLAGHDHWVIAAAISAALAAAAVAALKGRREEASEENEPELQEA